MSLENMRSFIDVVETGSYTQAALRSGVAKSVISRRVKAIEDRLGATLLNRSTRAISLTGFGQEYYETAVEIVTRYDNLHQTSRTKSAKVAGTLRLAMPLSFRALGLDSVLENYIKAFPDVQVNVHLSDQRSDIVSDGIDAAIRIGVLEDSGLIARRIGTVSFSVVAAPAYLASSPKLRHPDHLSAHKCLGYLHRDLGTEWLFRDESGPLRKKVKTHFRADNGEVLKSLAISGHGVVYLPNFLLRNEIAQGALVPVLEKFTQRESGIHVLFQQGKNQSAPLRAFIDMLVAQMPDQKPS